MAERPRGKPIPPAMMDRATKPRVRVSAGDATGASARFMAPKVLPGIDPASADTFFGPQQPIAPQAQEEAAGRWWDYPTGFNVRIAPREGEDVRFADLRALAESCELVRMAIETRKDQISRLPWNIIPRVADDDVKRYQKQIAMVEGFLRSPDRQHGWASWLRMLLEDMLVTDAAAIYPRRTLGGDLYSLDVMDGTMLRPVIDDWGRSPMPPEPAYQQVLHGFPAVNYTRDEVLYLPRNPRSFTVYGMSPVQQVIVAANMSIRRQLFQLNYYTEGTMPDSVVEMPPEMTITQIQAFQDMWDAVMSGNLAQRRKTKFLPAGMKYTPIKDAVLTDRFDEWLARLVMYAFSLPATPFVQQVNRATSETLQEAAESEGFAPLMLWVKDAMDRIISDVMGQPELTFQWSEDVIVSPLEQAQIFEIQVRNAMRTVNEARASDGLDPVDGGDVPMVFTGTGPIPLLQASEGSAMDDTTDDPGGGTPSGPGQAGERAGTKKLSGPTSTKLQGIDRARKALDRPRARISTIAAGALGSVAKDVARQLPRMITFGRKRMAVDGLRKASDEAGAIMAKINLDGFEVLVGPTQDLLDEIFQLGGRAAEQQLGVDDTNVTDVVNAKAIAYARDRAAELVKGISDTTRDSLRSTIEMAMTDNLTTDQLSEAIAGNFAFSQARADMIARTETARADVQGNLATYRASGVVTGKQWIKGSEHDDEDECDDNEGDGVIGLDEAFSSGDDGPPAHPNCVCDVIPVVDEEE